MEEDDSTEHSTPDKNRLHDKQVEKQAVGL